MVAWSGTGVNSNSKPGVKFDWAGILWFTLACAFCLLFWDAVIRAWLNREAIIDWLNELDRLQVCLLTSVACMLIALGGWIWQKHQ